MFEGFEARRLAGAGAEVAAWVGGDGPPLLLVHGYPQTHVMWHKVAPALAETHTVVAPDLRGYGASAKPPAGERSVNYSKRAMAADLAAAMGELGFERFSVVGHDRGGRVSYRLALDHPARVAKLCVLDILPTLEQFERMTKAGALAAFHWFFLAQPAPFPERLIGAEPDLFLDQLLGAWAGDVGALTPEAMAAYREAFRNPEVIRATCDDYRAGAGIDCELDRADREAGRRIAAPVLALWGERGARGNALMLEVWQAWAERAEGKALPCGHFIPEEAPEALLGELAPFLTG
ncbi:MAG: alpha/beta fold hydrolase [Acidimicrobiales bacterium]